MKNKCKLSAKYTMEVCQPTKHEFGEEVHDELAKILQVEIDREILEQITTQSLVDMGWTKILIQGWWHSNISSWLEQNMQRKYRLFHGSICFEDQQDAVFFTLRWANKDHE